MDVFNDSIAWRRIFLYLIVLVVVPTILLTLYGVAAITYLRVAVEADLAKQYDQQAKRVERGVFVEIARTEDAIEKALVGGMVYNAGVEGAADSYVDVWSTQVFLAYVAMNPGLNTPTFGLSFNWVGQNIGRNQPTNFQVMQKDDDEAGVRRIWTGYHCDEKIVAPELGFRIDTGIN